MNIYFPITRPMPTVDNACRTIASDIVFLENDDWVVNTIHINDAMYQIIESQLIAALPNAANHLTRYQLDLSNVIEEFDFLFSDVYEIVRSSKLNTSYPAYSFEITFNGITQERLL